MGLALWTAAGLVAFAIARLLPPARTRAWLLELLAALATALALGFVATARDFGGWKELDWRAGLFAFFGALAVLGVFRLVTIFRGRHLQ